jgi:hypothetical protein
MARGACHDARHRVRSGLSEGEGGSVLARVWFCNGFDKCVHAAGAWAWVNRVMAVPCQAWDGHVVGKGGAQPYPWRQLHRRDHRRGVKHFRARALLECHFSSVSEAGANAGHALAKGQPNPRRAETNGECHEEVSFRRSGDPGGGARHRQPHHTGECQCSVPVSAVQQQRLTASLGTASQARAPMRRGWPSAALRKCRGIVVESLGALRDGGIPMEVAMIGTFLVIVCALAIAAVGCLAVDPRMVRPTPRDGDAKLDASHPTR